MFFHSNLNPSSQQSRSPSTTLRSRTPIFPIDRSTSSRAIKTHNAKSTRSVFGENDKAIADYRKAADLYLNL